MAVGSDRESWKCGMWMNLNQGGLARDNRVLTSAVVEERDGLTNIRLKDDLEWKC